MDLVTDDSILWYFPPDDHEDIPRYAIQSKKDKPYEKIIPMIKDDVIEIQENGRKLILSLLQWQVGKIEKKDKKKLDKFLEEWNKGIEFLEKKEISEFEVKSDDDDEDPKEDVETGNEHNSLKVHLQKHEGDYIHEKPLKFRYLTWNLHGEAIYNSDQDISKLFVSSKPDDQIDIYFVAFQEIVPLSAKNLRSSYIPISNWTSKIQEIIGDDYKVIQTNKLLGLASILIIRDELSLNFQNISIDSVGTGILNFYGNKGAIATSFQIYDYKFALLNCHFAAGEKDQFLVKRRRELQGIKNYIKLPNSNGSLVSHDKSILFDVDEVDNLMRGVELESDEEESEDETTSALGEVAEKEEEESKKADDENKEESATEEPKEDKLDNEHKSQSNETTTPNSDTAEAIDGDKNIIFIGGDLNYRINASNEIIQQLLNEKDYKSLTDYDTLNHEKDAGRILEGFEEGPIRFPPTYKIDELKDGIYVEDRKPSYTDRVFNSKSKHVNLSSYRSPNINLSDHRPVIADFTINLPIIDNKKRNEIVTAYLKKVDDHENNSKKTSFQITNLETTVQVPILTSTTIDVQLKNVGDWKSYWEVIDSVENVDKKFPGKEVRSRVEPMKGVLPKNAIQALKITATLPIGCKKYERTLILRGYNSQDHFITCTFIAEPSYFGSSIDELNSNGHTGIPKPLYTLINYLTNNIIPDMFDETKLNFTHELEKKLIKAIDNNEDLDLKELERADKTINGSSSRAVSRVLLLLLRNLDGGIVSSDLSTFLLVGHKGEQDVLEKILESLPPLRANILIYLSSFLRLCIENGISKDEVFKKFENVLLEVPKQRKRDYMLGRTNYERLRRDFLQKLLG